MEKPSEEQDYEVPRVPPKPWPLSWILITILGYIVFQTAYFLFFSK